jgi:hypothetical protein
VPERNGKVLLFGVSDDGTVQTWDESGKVIAS